MDQPKDVKFLQFPKLQLIKLFRKLLDSKLIQKLFTQYDKYIFYIQLLYYYKEELLLTQITASNY